MQSKRSKHGRKKSRLCISNFVLFGARDHDEPQTELRGGRQDVFTQFWYGSSWGTKGMANYNGTALREWYGKLLVTCIKQLWEQKLDFSVFNSGTILFFSVQHHQAPEIYGI